MNCPSCRTLTTPGAGYPHLDIVNLNACKPDSRCLQIQKSSPVCYTDRQQYANKLLKSIVDVW